MRDFFAGLHKRMGWGETDVVVAAAFVLYLLRFWNLDTTPFLMDESAVQNMIDGHLASGTVPLTGLVGSQGIAYGPMSQWMYMPLRFVTSDVALLMAFNAACFGAALLMVFLAVRACMNERAAGWAALLAASSPYFFFYSRVLWETTFIMLTSAALLYGAVLLRTTAARRPWTWVWMGAWAGLAVNTHLLMIPVVGVAGAFALTRLRGDVRMRLHAALALAAFALVVAPYLLRALPEAGIGQPWNASAMLDTARRLPGAFVRYLSSDGMEYFFAPMRDGLPFWGRAESAAASLVSWVIIILAAGGAAACAADTWRRRAVPSALAFGLLSCIAVVAFYLFRTPLLGHPHYLLNIWWLPAVLAAAGLERIPRAGRAGFVAGAAACVMLNVVFVVSAQAFIERNGGTRGPYFGTVHGEVRVTAAEFCDFLNRRNLPAAFLDIGETPGVMQGAIRYFAAHEPLCAGKRILFHEPPEDRQFPVVRLQYEEASPYDASLRLRMGQP